MSHVRGRRGGGGKGQKYDHGGENIVCTPKEMENEQDTHKLFGVKRYSLRAAGVVARGGGGTER